MAEAGEIVTRLREVASWCPDDESYEGFVLLAEAADEIERLREALERAEPWLGYLDRYATDRWSRPERAVLEGDLAFARASLSGSSDRGVR